MFRQPGAGLGRCGRHPGAAMEQIGSETGEDGIETAGGVEGGAGNPRPPGKKNRASQPALHPHQTYQTEEKTTVNKLPISVCIISGAEAQRIGRLLASVAGWTSEIVVVLNEGVEDGTQDIALSFGAKIFRHPWQGFREQKNLA